MNGLKSMELEKSILLLKVLLKKHRKNIIYRPYSYMAVNLKSFCVHLN